MAGKVEQISVFRLPSDFDQQAAEARKRRRMADLLAQQVVEPTDYGRGPTPAAAPLVRGLQSFLAARAAKKADEAEETALETKTRTEREAEQRVTAAGSQIAGRLTGGAPMREVAPPDETGLGEVAIQSQYRADPQDAFRLALTPAGGQAMQRSPMLAALLAQKTKQPTAEEYGTPVVGEDRQYYLPGKLGGMKATGITAQSKTENQSPLAKLLSERDKLPPDSPLRSIYDQAINKETRVPVGPRINVDTGLSRNQQFTSENTLRDEYLKQTNDYRLLKTAYKKITSTADTGAGDMSFLYQFVKMLDPNSVTRESEFALAAESGKLGDRIKGAYLRIKTGRRLPPELKQQFLAEAENTFKAQESLADETAQEYRNLATQYGLDPARVVPGTVKPLPSTSSEDARYEQWKRQQKAQQGGGG